MGWTLVMYVWFTSPVFEGKSATISTTTFNDETLCAKAGTEFLNMTKGTYNSKFICVKNK